MLINKISVILCSVVVLFNLAASYMCFVYCDSRYIGPGVIYLIAAIMFLGMAIYDVLAFMKQI